MKNITVSLDDDTYRQARVRAAHDGRSVSSVVREHLKSYAAQPGALEQRRAELRAVLARMDAAGHGLRSEENLTRQELYDERFKR